MPAEHGFVSHFFEASAIGKKLRVANLIEDLHEQGTMMQIHDRVYKDCLFFFNLYHGHPAAWNRARTFQNMFASLLAASRASNLGLVGCTRTDADMYAGRIPPSGSTSAVLRGIPSTVPRRWTGSDDINGPPRSGSVLEGRGTEGGDPALSACAEDDCTIMDFVPSTNRPPRGGSVLRTLDGDEAGELL
jgi:hypothetical protein